MKSVMDIAIVQLIVTGLASYSEYDSNGHSYKVYMYVYCEYAEQNSDHVVPRQKDTLIADFENSCKEAETMSGEETTHESMFLAINV